MAASTITRQIGYSSARSMRRCSDVPDGSVGDILAFYTQQITEATQRADRHARAFDLAAKAVDVHLDSGIRDLVPGRVDLPQDVGLAHEATATIPQDLEHFVLAP